jgi:PIN domain nuclease of toxin-antitoxin system
MPRADVFVLDTHVWLDLAFGRQGSFAKKTLRALERAAGEGAVYVAAITPWEVAMLARAAKIRVAVPIREFVLDSLRDTRTSVAPLDPSIAVDAVELPAWDHRDPADRLIVATARSLGAVLLTRDASILDYAESVKAVRARDPK